jgi:hypothetical protein
MSLTSYRAAPPRDKPLRALRESFFETVERRGMPRQIRFEGLPEKATRGKRQPGAGGMYQRRPALERVRQSLFSIL